MTGPVRWSQRRLRLGQEWSAGNVHNSNVVFWPCAPTMAPVSLLNVCLSYRLLRPGLPTLPVVDGLERSRRRDCVPPLACPESGASFPPSASAGPRPCLPKRLLYRVVLSSANSALTLRPPILLTHNLRF